MKRTRRSIARLTGLASLAAALLCGAPVIASPPSVAAEASDSWPLAEQHWVQNCMGCHTATGAGIAGKVPPLAHSLGYFERVPGGREYVMRVPGASNSALSDQQLADVLNWLLATMNREALPPGFKPYTAAEIAAHRHPAYADVAPRRAALVREMQRRGIHHVALNY